MSKHKKYTPKHAAPSRSVLPAGSGKVLGTAVVASGVVSVTLTGASVAGGLVAADPVDLSASLTNGAVGEDSSTSTGTTAGGASVAPASASGNAPLIATRHAQVSRSATRPAADATKASLLDTSAGASTQREASMENADPRDIAKALLPSYGFSSAEFGCLDRIWTQESNWRVDADNPSSSAYGIPQALVATHDMPAGYMTSAEVQIRWGLDYIRNRYGTPCNAWGFKSGHGWY